MLQTGPVFSANPTLLKNKLPIPQYMYKAIYIPSKIYSNSIFWQKIMIVGYKYVSVNQLKDLTGVDVFPALTDLQKIVLFV